MTTDSPAPKPRLLILLVTYGDCYPGAEEEMYRIARSIRLPKRLVVIRNDRPGPWARRRDDWNYEIGGDNATYEFSGWQSGLDCEPSRSFDADAVLFANSSFITHRFHSLPVLDTDIVKAFARGRGIGGHVRRLGYKAQWQGLDFSLWVVTHYFLVSAPLVQALGSMVTEPSADRFLSPVFRPNPLTNDELWQGPMKHYLWAGLTRKYRRQGRAFEPDSYDFFRRKILCIVNEMSLTARARKLGFAVDDLSPLSGVLDFPLVISTSLSEIRPFQYLRRIVLDNAAGIARRILKNERGDQEIQPTDPLTAWCLSRAKRRLDSKGT